MIHAINLQAKTESEYYKEQSGIAANLRALGLWWRESWLSLPFLLQ